MSSTLLHSWPTAFGKYGVLETSCYPASFYAGWVQRTPEGEWLTCDNSTSRWHRTIDAAIQAAKAELKGLDTCDACTHEDTNLGDCRPRNPIVYELLHCKACCIKPEKWEAR